MDSFYVAKLMYAAIADAPMSDALRDDFKKDVQRGPQAIWDRICRITERNPGVGRNIQQSGKFSIEDGLPYVAAIFETWQRAQRPQR